MEWMVAEAFLASRGGDIIALLAIQSIAALLLRLLLLRSGRMEIRDGMDGGGSPSCAQQSPTHRRPLAAPRVAWLCEPFAAFLYQVELNMCGVQSSGPHSLHVFLPHPPTHIDISIHTVRPSFVLSPLGSVPYISETE